MREAGIRANLRPIERAGFFKSYSEKKYKGMILGASAAFGNAATRLEAFVTKSGGYAYGNYPAVVALVYPDARRLRHPTGQALLHPVPHPVGAREIAPPRA